MEQRNEMHKENVAKKALLFRKDWRVYDCGENFEQHGFECTCVTSFFHFLDQLQKGSFDVIVVGALYNDCTLEDVLNVCYEKSPNSYLICSSFIASSVPDWFMEQGGDLIIDEYSSAFPQKKVLQLFNSPSGLARRKIKEAESKQVQKDQPSVSLQSASRYVVPVLLASAICIMLLRLGLS